jgi:hypothetical protein
VLKNLNRKQIKPKNKKTKKETKDIRLLVCNKHAIIVPDEMMKAMPTSNKI